MSQTVFRAGKIHTPKQTVDDGAVWVEGKKIRAVGRWADLTPPSEVEIVDVRPHCISPGFLDLHIHGGKGSDFMDDTDEDFETIVRHHAAGGTTALLATTCCAPIPDLCQVLERIGIWQSRPPVGSRILGAHVEGPFFNLDMRGCHLPEYVIAPDAASLGPLLDHASAICHTTLAPDIAGALDAIAQFHRAGVSVSAAHTLADCDQVDAAIERGLHHVTHLYNAMSVFVQHGPRRVPGLAEMALIRDKLTVELVADGFHVHPLRMQLALNAKGVDGVCLVTDAMRGAGMPDGLYAFGPKTGKQSFVRDGISIMPEGVGYASSTIQMIRTVQVMVDTMGLPLADALTMASANPAKVIGVDNRKGSLQEGMDADLVVLDDKLRVQLTMVEGEVVYSLAS